MQLQVPITLNREEAYKVCETGLWCSMEKAGYAWAVAAGLNAALAAIFAKLIATQVPFSASSNRPGLLNQILRNSSYLHLCCRSFRIRKLVSDLDSLSKPKAYPIRFFIPLVYNWGYCLLFPLLINNSKFLSILFFKSLFMS